MANVNIKFNNKDYLLSCDDGQEESLKKLTKFLDKKYTELKDKLGNIGENKLLLITTIQLIDDYNINGDFVESQAFAYLAIRSILSLPISFPSTTGCEIPSIGGEIIEN